MRREATGKVPRHQQRRVAIVEDHLLQRRRTEELVTAQAGLRVVWSGETLPDFVVWLAEAEEAARPHILVLDLQVDRGDSADPDTVRSVVNAGIRVLALSAMASPALVRQILRAGIGGMVGKRDDESAVVGAIWTVLGGGTWVTPELASVMAGDPDRPRLSDQEERALVLYASGLTLESVAEALGVQRDTAKKYLSRVKAKYAAAGQPVRTKLDLNAIAQRDGYLDPTGRTD
ncbi:hypothetical protein NODU109028_02610 [Nocardioides dubius]|uniref:Response regulator transcription factor n=1 Tax=Nocardioides dubius TaxID=317019 RepID=A0ABP4EAT8_9ACTN